MKTVQQANEVFNFTKERNFTQISNELLLDKRLTFGARGLLAMMLSRPKNWQFFKGELASNTTETEYAVTKLLKELSEKKYIYKFQVGVKGEIKKFKWLWFINEMPFTDEQMKYIDTKFRNHDNIKSTTSCINDNRKSDVYSNTNLLSNTDLKDKKIDTINQSSLDNERVEFRKNFREYINIVSKSTGLDIFRIENVIQPSLFKDIEIKEVIEKIKESDFLQGLKEDKPKIGNFTTKNMLNRILIDSYKNKNTVKEKNLDGMLKGIV
ncbi:MAG: hypothetical protein ACRCX2_05060 [Paraclostridium sp.]